MASIVLQNQYLMGCITPRPVRRRQTTDPNKPDKPQWTYTVGGGTIEVCRHIIFIYSWYQTRKIERSHGSEETAKRKCCTSRYEREK